MRAIVVARFIALFCLFIVLAGLGIALRARALAKRPAIDVNLCALAQNRDMFWDRRLKMTAEYIPGVEHSFLSDPACPEAFVPYEIYSDPSDESIAAQLLSDRFGSQIRIAFDATLVVRPTLRSWWCQLVRELGFHNPYPGVLQIKNLRIVPAASAMPPT